MLKFGPAYSVHLACGHKQQVMKHELKEKQLFIGKPVPCTDCNSPVPAGQGYKMLAGGQLCAECMEERQ